MSNAAHAAIWKYPEIEGCFEQVRIEPDQQEKITPKGVALLRSFTGIAHLPDGKSLPAGTFVVRESDGPDGELLTVEDGGELRPDWVGFFVATGALAAVYPLDGWPFGGQEREASWREPLNRWLAALGAEVFRHVPFRLGLIGCEISGTLYSADLVRTGIPENRWIDYLWPQEGQLQHYPANRFPYGSPG